ncbi:MAG: transposase zinc-binding domain-containing protein, partial [Verrucomicrobia bacterium]|nr:transposase zinc-binding domain-containing protein [Verrucomicrobiota bacterium]
MACSGGYASLACVIKLKKAASKATHSRFLKVERFYPRFEAVYEERYQERYGFWRPAIGTAVEEFLECGDLKQGFARVRCPDCGHELFAALSCHGRCFCPSCHQKRALQTALWVSQEVCAP